MFLKTIFLTGHFRQNNMVKLNQNQVITFTRIGWSVFPDSPLITLNDFLNESKVDLKNESKVDLKNESQNDNDCGPEKYFSKESLFWGKYHDSYKVEIDERVELYIQKKADEEEKKFIKQQYLENERKKRLREEARNELIAEGHIKVYDMFNQDKRKISQEVKDQVWNRDNGKCVECGSNEKLEFDHIIPFSKGGSNTYRNIQLLCEKCNREKSNKIG